MTILELCRAFSRACFVPALAFCTIAAPIAGKANASTLPRIPVQVTGFLPGYPDATLQRLITKCAARPFAGVSAAVANGLSLHISLDNEYLPHAATRIRLHLLRNGKTVAYRWARTSAAVPSQNLCWVTINLTEQAWSSIQG
jgi:hypothetical protein